MATGRSRGPRKRVACDRAAPSKSTRRQACTPNARTLSSHSASESAAVRTQEATCHLTPSPNAIEQRTLWRCLLTLDSSDLVQFGRSFMPSERNTAYTTECSCARVILKLPPTRARPWQRNGTRAARKSPFTNFLRDRSGSWHMRNNIAPTFTPSGLSLTCKSALRS